MHVLAQMHQEQAAAQREQLTHVQSSGKMPRGYTAGYGGLGLHADLSPPKPGSAGSVVGGNIHRGQMCAWEHRPLEMRYSGKCIKLRLQLSSTRHIP